MAWEPLQVLLQTVLPCEYFATGGAGEAASLTVHLPPVVPEMVDGHQPPRPAALLGPALGGTELQMCVVL